MKLRNKKTGEIATVEGFGSTESEIQMTYTIDNDETKLYLYCTSSLTTFNADWEDYEELEDVWYIDWKGDVRVADGITNDWTKEKEIGNYFETREEAEKAVEKLKAWKRLKDKGFRFNKWFTRVSGGLQINVKFDEYCGIIPEDKYDLDLLFGGEE